MKRIIINIENENETTIEESLKYALRVIQKGKISETKKGKQFCFHTIFNNKIHVSVTKRKSGTETFNIFASKQ